MMILIPVKGHTRNGKQVKPHVRLVDSAMDFARERHKGQTRADGVTPYIIHPESVINVLRRHGSMDAHVLAAAALHDIVEDTPTRLDEVRMRFGDDVADLVQHLTDEPGLKGRARKERQIERILRAPTGAQQIKLADRISNMRDAIAQPPDRWSQEDFDTYVEFAEKLAGALHRVHPELCHELTELCGKARGKKVAAKNAAR